MSQVKLLRKELEDVTEQQTVLVNKLWECCHEVRSNVGVYFPSRLTSSLQSNAARMQQLFVSLREELDTRKSASSCSLRSTLVPCI